MQRLLRTDSHQHLWPEPFLAELARRRTPPCLRQDDRGGWCGWPASPTRSAGAVAVARGAVREDRLALGGASVSRVVGAGEAFSFAASDIHRVLHAGEEPAVTLHAYSPPLSRMGAYEVGSDGVLTRRSLSQDDELRPLPGARALAGAG